MKIDNRKNKIKNTAKNLSIVIVASNFNGRVVNNLVKGAKAALTACGVKKIKIVRVPGAFEIPLAVKAAAAPDFKVDGVVALGCVIKGETAHFEYVAEPVSHSLNRLSVDLKIPVGFGVLACYTAQQAYDRSRIKPLNADTNKGYESAMAVIEMINVLKNFSQKSS